jgi:hypothetical protein
MLTNFPKIECPFVRQSYKINISQWNEFGKSLMLRTPEVYLVIDKVNPGFEWVFEDPDTIAVEKLDGTNIKILTENKNLITIQNRLNIINLNPINIKSGHLHILEGIFSSVNKIQDNGEQAGELIGPKINGNPYKLDKHKWYPFDLAITNLKYRSFEEHDKNFDSLSFWFKDYLFSRYYSKITKNDSIFAEGVIFYNLKRKINNQTYMAKLRRDMFDWYYTDHIEIYDYSPKI